MNPDELTAIERLKDGPAYGRVHGQLSQALGDVCTELRKAWAENQRLREALEAFAICEFSCCDKASGASKRIRAFADKALKLTTKH